MATPVEIVTQFLQASSGNGERMEAAVRAAFTSDTVWENVGIATTVGPDQAIAYAHQAEQMLGYASIDIETLHIAGAGNAVLTERIDRLLAADGREVASIRLMGVFEVKDGRIIRWRDYFDTAALLKQ
jgi:limonene-1,2-epoxide hydrolase